MVRSRTLLTWISAMSASLSPQALASSTSQARRMATLRPRVTTCCLFSIALVFLLSPQWFKSLWLRMMCLPPARSPTLLRTSLSQLASRSRIPAQATIPTAQSAPIRGLPAGASASFNPASISTAGSSTLNVTTGSSTAPGSYPLTITATSGALTHTANVTLVVSADFSLAVTPSSATVSRGSSANYTLTITPGPGFNGTVSFSVSGLPRRANNSFSPSSITTSGSSTLTVSTMRKTPTGTFTLTISATSGGLKHTWQVTLTVQ